MSLAPAISISMARTIARAWAGATSSFSRTSSDSSCIAVMLSGRTSRVSTGPRHDRDRQRTQWRCAKTYEARSLGVLLRSDLPQRLLEHLMRLAARDQVLAVDDHGRHAIDAELL